MRRHHLCRTPERSRGQRNELLQLIRHLLQQRLLDPDRRVHVFSDESAGQRAVITAGARGDDVGYVAVSAASCASVVASLGALYEASQGGGKRCRYPSCFHHIIIALVSRFGCIFPALAGQGNCKLHLE